MLAQGSRAEPCAPLVESGAWAPVAVAPGVWRFPAARGRSNRDNAGRVTQLVVVRDARRTWLIGSGPTPAEGQRLRCTIERTVGQPVTDVVNTRAHPELAMGNAAFAGARHWALPDVAAAMRERCPSCVEALRGQLGAAASALHVDDVRVPTHAVGSASARTGRLGPFTWLAWPRAPGERALVLWLREKRLVVAQGWLWAGALPDLRETALADVQAGLARLAGIARGQRLLGEQGGVADSAEVEHHRAYLHDLRRHVDAALRRGDDVESVLGHPFARRYLRIAEDTIQHALNVQRVWREREDAWFRR